MNAITPGDVPEPRVVIVHYHFFKAAGTSVERALRDNFGKRWKTREGSDSKVLSPGSLGAFIAQDPELTAVSSHTAALPPPDVPGVQIVPVIFVRHPLDRARSVYHFERHQRAGTLGARTARQTDLAGYVRWRLDRAASARDPSFANFQATRLAAAGNGSTVRERALRAMERLPFIGVVEEYERSLIRLETLLRRHFPEIKLTAYRENVTAQKTNLDERLADLHADLGAELYSRLEAANQDDLAVWHRAIAAYGSKAGGGAHESPGRSASLIAEPNPIEVADGTNLGATTLRWETNVTDLEIHLGRPDGPLFVRSSGSGSATTGKWVHDGMTFFLQDIAGDRPLKAAHTLAAATVGVRAAAAQELTGERSQRPMPLMSGREQPRAAGPRRIPAEASVPRPDRT